MKKIICIILCFLCMAPVLLGIYPTTQIANIKAQEARYSLEIGTMGGSLVTTVSRTVPYAYRTDDTYINPYEAPTFIPSLPNSCAVESGGNVIVYYDRLYDELIPSYTHKYIFGGFTYGSQNEAVDNMFLSLYGSMETTSAGTSIEGFKSGLNTYVNGRGRHISIAGATGNYYNTNIDFIKSQLQQEKMAVVFFDTFSITAFVGLQNYSGYDKISHSIYTGCHTMLVYGYKDIYYYDANMNLITRDTYFFAATGFTGARLALVNIQNYCVIDDVYILNIF